MTTIEASIAYIAALMSETNTDEMIPVDEYDIYATFDLFPKVAEILPYLLHPEPIVRAVAAAVCGCYHLTEAASNMYHLTHDGDSWVREMARWSLTCIDSNWRMYGVWDTLLLVLDLHLSTPRQLALFT